jgi:hypothetical protein
MMTHLAKPTHKLIGLIIEKSRYYHGRYECVFYGARGRDIKQWLRDTFGANDDMIYAADDSADGINACSAMINDQQLMLLLLRWS